KTEAPRDTGSQTRDAPPLCRRARHRPSQGRAPNGPQLSRPSQRRLQQRHPRRRRLQLPPPHQVAEHFVVPHPDCALPEVKTIARLKTYCSQKTDSEALSTTPSSKSPAKLPIRRSIDGQTRPDAADNLLRPWQRHQGTRRGWTAPGFSETRSAR